MLPLKFGLIVVYPYKNKFKRITSYFTSFAVFIVQFSKCPLHLSSLVGSSGLEPPTSRLSGVRSNQLSYEPILSFFGFLHLSLRLKSRGGDEQNRTVDPLLARQVLSQLSYTPKVSSGVS